jgi:hypothetical protein
MSSQLQVTGEAKIRDIQGPVVANSGIITALDGAASQYVRGDGTLADFPTSSGGGSSVSYYLNSSVSQGTIGGVAYRELSKEPIIGAGTDIAISSNGYVASYLTDANDPDVVLIPGGNFNCEFYFSVNNNTGNPFFYAELYKYDGTTFTLLGSSVSVPEYITQGTTIAPYYFAIPVATATLALTDRLAIRIYVNVGGRTVTLHTENGHLCQVVTTLSKGMVSLNNLTDQSQFLTTGTSGTNFTIASSGDTHTFNLPIASATNTGKLSSTDWSTFNGKVPYTGATGSVDLGVYSLSAGELNIEKNGANTSAINFEQATGTSILGAGYTSIGPIGTDGVTFFFGGATNSLTFKNNLLSASRSYSLPDATGTLALTSNLSSYVPYTGATANVDLGTNTLTALGVLANSFSAIGNSNPSGNGGYIFLKQGIGPFTYDIGYNSITANSTRFLLLANVDASNNKSALLELGSLTNNTSRTFTLPDLSGTLALLEGTQTFSGAKTFGSSVSINTGGQADLSIVSSAGNSSNINSFVGGVLKSTISTSATEFKLISAIDNILKFQSSTNFRASLIFSNSADYSYTFPAASGTLALTSNLSSYVPYTGATGAVNLGAFDLTVNGLKVGRGGGGISTNTVLGESALNSNTTGSTNTAIGYGALQLNTTGLSNTAIGHAALNYNTTSSWNTAVGVSALGLSTGGQNTAIGYGSLGNSTTGVFNIAIGYLAATSITTGNFNTIIGNYAGTAAMSNNIILADGAGNIRYQWNGTNNVFGNPISGTSATFSLGISAVGGISFPETVGGSNYGGITGSSSFLQIAAQNGSAILFKSSNNTNAITISTVGKVDFGSTIGNGTFTYTLPSATGTIAITSNLSAYLPLTGGTLTGALSGTSATFSGNVNATNGLLIGNGGSTATTNYLPKFTGASTIGNSLVYDNGTNVGVNTASPNDYIDGESGMAILRATNGRAVLSLVGTRTDAGETLGRISFTNTNSTNAGNKRLAYISGTRGTTNNSAYLEFAVANDAVGSVAMTLSQSGNLGLGVTPSAWTDYKVLQLGGGSISSYTDNNFFEVNQNSFWNGVFRYVNNGFASRYQQTSGRHEWYQAPSGTAGNAITFTQAMTLNASGNLGIGSSATSPVSKLSIGGNGYAGRAITAYANNADYAITFQQDNGSGGGLQMFSTASTWGADPIRISDGTSTQLNLKSNGNLLIGTTTDAGYKLDVNGTGRFSSLLTINANSSANALAINGRSSDNTSSVDFFQNNGTTRLMEIGISPSAAEFYYDANAPMIFSTNGAPRMRITSGGKLLVNRTTTIFTNSGHTIQGDVSAGGEPVLEVYNQNLSDSSPAIGCFKNSGTTTSSARFIQFYADGGSIPMGGIVGNGTSNVQFASISDIREKENIVTITGSLSKILALNPVQFDWIKTKEHVNAGFVAQQVEEVFPEYVVENMSKDGEEERKGLTGGLSSGIVAHLVAAIKEQQAQIEELKAKIK